MAYTLSQFITHAQAGDPVAITKPAGGTQQVIKIGTSVVTLIDDRITVTMTGMEKAATHSFQQVLDLGTLFSASQVLESMPLRQAIIDGVVTADAGTVALSKTPVA